MAYQPQALWTAARQQLDMVVIIFANRKYNILHNEMRNVGVPEFGPKAQALLDIDNPAIDFVSLATALGVPAAAVSTMDELSALLDESTTQRGPFLIEVRL